MVLFHCYVSLPEGKSETKAHQIQTPTVKHFMAPTNLATKWEQIPLFVRQTRMSICLHPPVS